jgi:hypothetical protein
MNITERDAWMARITRALAELKEAGREPREPGDAHKPALPGAVDGPEGTNRAARRE